MSGTGGVLGEGVLGEAILGGASTGGGSIPLESNPWHFYAYDFLTGNFIAEVPIRGVRFNRILNGVGTLNGTVDLRDPRVRQTNVIAATLPNKTVLVVDYRGKPVWAGISQPRKWEVDASSSGTTGVLSLSYVELWAYFQQRIQATDYSSPPYSGITGGPIGEPTPMKLWPTTPWFAPLIACQVVEDAIGYSDSALVPYGNPLGGLSVLFNGHEPIAQYGYVVNPSDLVAVSYPFPSMQTVDSIVSQLSQLGLGVGFDFSVEPYYEGGKPMGKLRANFDVSWPWRGFLTSPLWTLDLSTARKYAFPEDGSQTGNQLYEIGGGGAISVHQNVAPLQQGYPLLERTMSRSSIQSPGIMEILNLIGEADLTLLSYAPVTPTATIGLQTLGTPRVDETTFGVWSTGCLMNLWIPAMDGDGNVFDPRFPGGLEQTWRTTAYTVNIPEQGEATVDLSFAQPVLYLSEVNGAALH